MSISWYFGTQSICVTNFAHDTVGLDYLEGRINSFFQINSNTQRTSHSLIECKRLETKSMLQFNEEKQEAPKICLQQRPNSIKSQSVSGGNFSAVHRGMIRSCRELLSCSARMEKGQPLFFLLFLCAVRVKTKGSSVLRHGLAFTHPRDLNSVLWFSSSNYITLFL